MMYIIYIYIRVAVRRELIIKTEKNPNRGRRTLEKNGKKINLRIFRNVFYQRTSVYNIIMSLGISERGGTTIRDFRF